MKKLPMLVHSLQFIVYSSGKNKKTTNYELRTTNKLHPAFTLIELLVVITIIAILLGTATFSFLNSQQKGRDAKRKADLAAIQQTLELFKADNGYFPTNYPAQYSRLDRTTYNARNVYITCVTTSDPPSSAKIDWGSPFTCNNKTYMPMLPNDPQNGTYIYKNYEYNYTDANGYEFTNAPAGWCQPDIWNGGSDNYVTVKNCSHYTLWATLENLSDPDIQKTLADPVCKLAMRYAALSSTPDFLGSDYTGVHTQWYPKTTDTPPNPLNPTPHNYWSDYWTSLTPNWTSLVNLNNPPGATYPADYEKGFAYWALEDPDRTPTPPGTANYCVHD